MKKTFLLNVIAFFIITCIHAQNVGINNTGALPNASAMLDVNHPNKGLLVPRVALTGTTDVSTIVTPPTSLLVYNTASIADVTPGYYYWSSTAWLRLTTGLPSANNWLLTGNAGTVDGTNFIGTTDNVPFNVRVNNQKAGRIDHTLGNTFWGYLAGNGTITTGFNNTGNGTSALQNITSGNFNTANGANALQNITTANNNTANGSNALRDNTFGFRNTATGASALQANTTGNSNTANGASALQANTTGNTNTANGASALFNNTSGFQNTATGAFALFSNTIGNYNTANGESALSSNTTGERNTATGAGALLSNTTGNYNTANGEFALKLNTTGSSNSATGKSSLSANTTGTDNTANGTNALSSNTTGGSNTASGSSALWANTIGINNSATGASALGLNTTGNNNTASGQQALLFNTEGSFNTATGRSAMSSNTTGIGNTANGASALSSNVSGSYNTAVGYGANVSGNNLTNATAIGNGAVVSASHTIKVGNADVTDVYFGNGTTTILHGTLAGSTGLAFADFYALMPADNAAPVTVGTSVQFPQDGSTNGVITRTGASTFNLPAIGTYEITFQVSVQEPGQLVLVLNGIERAATVVGRAQGNSQITGSCLITTTTINSVLSINNPIGNPFALTISPLAGGTQPVSAHLVIKQLN